MFHPKKKKEKELGTVWMDFYINVWFPIVIAINVLTILSNFGNSYIAKNNGYVFYEPSYYALSILFNIFLLVANIFVYRAMKTKSLDAVSKNFALMILWTFFFTILQFVSTRMWLSLVITPIICSLWVVPNTIYFNKRRHLFFQDFYDIKRKACEGREKQEQSVSTADVNSELKTINEEQQTNTDLRLDSSEENKSSKIILLGPSTATKNMSTQSSENISTSQKNEQEQSSIPETGQRFCTKCGERLKIDWRRCPSCGKRISKPKKNKSRKMFNKKHFLIGAFIILLFVLLIISTTVFAVLFNNQKEKTARIQAEFEYSESQREEWFEKYQKSTKAIDVLSDKYNKCHDDYYNLKWEYSDLESENEWFKEHIAFVIEDQYYYHSYDCDAFQNADSYWAYNIDAAKYDGYKPHKACCDVFD